jgi:hypothetical protein
MIKALVKDGVLVPCDPLPADWQEGTEVEVERTARNGAVENGVDSTDAWMDEVERCAALQDPADDLRLEAALQMMHRREKELARKRLGLDP